MERQALAVHLLPVVSTDQAARVNPMALTLVGSRIMNTEQGMSNYEV
jgi:hypothetical protein